MSNNCFRLFTDSFIDFTELANADVTSEQTAFPVSNLYNQNRRSKVWRSNGYFLIESGSNSIDFKETSGGGTLTATVTASGYTSASSLATAIKTALDSAGSSTYTVTYNSDLKFVITSDGGGGGGDFELLWSSSTDMADILGFDSTDITGALTYTADVIRINTYERITWDMGLASNPKVFCMIGGNRNGFIQISPGATIKLMGNPTNNFSGTPAYSNTLTYDDEVISALSTTGLHTLGLRYWALQIHDQNPLGYIELGAAYLGDYFAPTVRGGVGFPFGKQFQDRSVVLFSEGGQQFTDIFPQSARFSVNWNGLTKTEIEEIEDIFEEFGTAKPFFVSMDSSAAFSSNANRRIKYVNFDGEPSYSLVSPNNFTCSMSLREAL